MYSLLVKFLIKNTNVFFSLFFEYIKEKTYKKKGTSKFFELPHFKALSFLKLANPRLLVKYFIIFKSFRCNYVWIIDLEYICISNK